jgi:hypothetical protein
MKLGTVLSFDVGAPHRRAAASAFGGRTRFCVIDVHAHGRTGPRSMLRAEWRPVGLVVGDR